jgi:hypothetical protein
MKQITHCLLIFLFLISLLPVKAQVKISKLSPAEIAQGQLDAYNQQDIEGFLKWYAEDVEVYNFPNELVYQGKEQMRKVYTNAWARNPKQKAAVSSRMGVGNTVMDKEHVTGRANGVDAQVIAIYKIENDKIKRVYFVRE